MKKKLRRGRWSEADWEFFRSHYGRMPVRHVAEELQRPIGSVYRAAQREHLRSECALRMERRAAYCAQFGVSMGTVKQVPLAQLDGCADDCARRLLLGVGEQFGKRKPVARETRILNVRRKTG